MSMRTAVKKLYLATLFGAILLLPLDRTLSQNLVFDYVHPVLQASFESVAADYGDSGYVVAGYVRTQATYLQAMILKFNNTGQVQWGGTYGGITDEQFMGVDATADQGAIAVGKVSGPNGATAKYLAVKYNLAGSEMWHVEGGDPDCSNQILDVKQLPGGSYILAGYRYCQGANPNDYDNSFYLVKLNATGGEDWEKTFGTAKFDRLDCIELTSDGGFVVAGQTCDNAGLTCAAVVIKLDANGNQTWTYTGAFGYNDATGIRQLRDGGYIVSADHDSDVQLIRLDSSGAYMWDRIYALTGQQDPRDVEVHCDGGYTVVGLDRSQLPKRSQVDVLRIASDGTQIWRNNYGNALDDFGRAVTTGVDGGIVVAETRDQQVQLGTAFFYGGLLKLTDDSRELVVMSSGNTALEKTEVEIRKFLSGSPQWRDTVMYLDTTDAFGKICVCDTVFGKNVPFKISKILHSEPATRHAPYFGTKYSVSVDNMNLLNTGAVEFDTVSDAREQNVVLDHTTFSFNLAVSVEWDTRDGYVNSLQDAFRELNNYLCDVYDGQVLLDTVAILDDGQHWNAADVRYYASNMEWPRATAAGIDDPPPAVMHMPRNFHGSADDTRNLTFTSYPYNLTTSSQVRTMGHELGHYILGFKDEYVFPVGSGKCASNPDYGYMETQYNVLQPMTSEMSSSLQYTDVACQNTAQYVENGASCWDYFEQRFQKKYSDDSVFAEVTKPTERTLPSGQLYAAGPNENVSALDFDAGAKVVFSQPDFNASSATKTVTARRRTTNALMKKLAVNLRKVGGAVIEQGQTSNGGKILVLDVSPGDRIRAAGSARLTVTKNNGRGLGEEWLFGEAIDGAVGKSQFGNQFSAFADDIDLELIPVQGEHEFIVEFTPGVSNNTLTLFVNSPFATSPSVDHTPEGGSMQSSNLLLSGVDYSGVIAGESGLSGQLTINAVDDSLAQFFVNVDYVSSSPYAGGTLSANDGSASLSTAPASPFDEALLLTSAYPILRNGLGDDNVQAGKATSIGLQPEASFDGELVIRYADSDMEVPGRAAGDESSLRIFKWDTQARLWSQVGGAVDTAFNEVTGQISSDGVYAAFTTTLATAPPCGDMDNSGRIDISDAVYLINYIFAGGLAPQDDAAGDIDCSARTDITDVVYMINYIFAGGLSPCTACR